MILAFQERLDGTVKIGNRQPASGLESKFGRLLIVATLVVMAIVFFFFVPIIPTPIPTRCAGPSATCWYTIEPGVSLAIESGYVSLSHNLFGYGVVYVPETGCAGFLTDRLPTSLPLNPLSAGASFPYFQCP
jgi:hypothetical protein